MGACVLVADRRCRSVLPRSCRTRADAAASPTRVAPTVGPARSGVKGRTDDLPYERAGGWWVLWRRACDWVGRKGVPTLLCWRVSEDALRLIHSIRQKRCDLRRCRRWLAL